jgi:hypothetical protein
MLNTHSIPEDLLRFYAAKLEGKSTLLEKLDLHFFEQLREEFINEFLNDLEQVDYYLDTYGETPEILSETYQELLSEMTFMANDVGNARYLGYWTGHPDANIKTHLLSLSLEDGKIEFCNSSLYQYLLSNAYYFGEDKFLETVRTLQDLGFENLPNDIDAFSPEELNSNLPNPMERIHQNLDEFEGNFED